MSNSAGTINCSNCDRAFRWKPELAGRSVRCKCGTRLAVSQTPPVQEKPKARPEPEAEFNPFSELLDNLKEAETGEAAAPQFGLQTLPQEKRSWRKSAKESASSGLSDMSSVGSNDGGDAKLKVAGVGLLIHFGGFVLIAIAMCWVVFYVMSYGMPESGGPRSEFNSKFGYAFLTAMGMIFLGPLLSLGVPNQAGRGMLVGGLLSYIVAIILPFVAIGPQQASKPPVSFIVAAIAAAVLMLIGTGFVLSFLVRLSAYLDESSLQAKSESLLGLYKFVLAGYIIALGLMFIPVVGAIVNVLISLLIMVLIVRYILLNGRLALVMLRR